jgi:RND family efflux transporter MFP subunit
MIKRQPGNKPGIMLLLCCLPLLLQIGACGRRERTVAADEEAAVPSTMPVVVQKLQPGTFELTVDIHGSTEAIQEVDISAEVGGTVVSFARELGDPIMRGELILSLDPRLYRARVDQARAGLLAAEASMKQAAREFERARSLKERKRISDVEFENLELVKLQAESGFYAARAGLDQAEVQFEHTEIRAPFAGRLAFKGAEAGELVGPGMPVASIVDLSGVLIRSSVSERDAMRITRGMPVSVTLPALDNIAFAGKVRALGVRSHPVTRSFDIEIVIDDPEGRILSGMAASASIVVDRQEQALTIPSTAIVDQYGKPFVFIVAENRALRREVSLGSRAGDRVLVTSGLKAGDMLIIKGQWSVKDGILVEISE